MLWRWFQDWRDRRAILRDMVKSQRANEAVLRDQNQNPANLALLAVVADPVEAALQWERARALMPTAVLNSSESLDILLGLERYDEAEALMRERLRRFRGDHFALIGLARIAQYRDDIEETLRRWDVVRRRVTGSVEGYLGCIHCLVQLNRLDEADALISGARRRDPQNLDVLIWRARISDKREDWNESLAQWRVLAEVHGDRQAFAIVGRVLVELGRIEEAEAWLKDASLRFITDLDIAVVRAEIAQKQGDLAAACERWATVRGIAPSFPPAYYAAARALVDAERPEEAEAVLRTAITRFPEQPWPLRDLAHTIHNRREWDNAAALWAELRERFPAERDGYVLGAAALTAAGREVEAAAVGQPP